MTSDIQDQIRQLQSRSKGNLKQLLSQELEEAYNRKITNSLRNGLMTACFEQIEPEQDPLVKVRSHANYSPSWSKKKQLATVLRMLLTERVGRAEHEGITSVNKKVLAEVIVAIQHDDGKKQNQNGESKEPVDVPNREPPVESAFENPFPAENFGSYDLYTWIVERRSSNDGEHGVYVLDCTPPIDEDEDFRMRSIRREGHQNSMAGQPLTKLERAAQALNHGERIYYVGYASDVPSRIRQHVRGADSGGAKFTNMFSPQSLVEVTWYQTESTARSHEARRAEELTVSGRSFGYAE